MIYFEFYNLIIRQATLEEKYPGGIDQFKMDIPNSTFHADEYLATARFLKLEHITQFLEFLQEKGLHFNMEQFHSDDFVVLSFLGFWWNCEWLETNVARCWLKGTN